MDEKYWNNELARKILKHISDNCPPDYSGDGLMFIEVANMLFDNNYDVVRIIMHIEEMIRLGLIKIKNKKIVGLKISGEEILISNGKIFISD